jgi:hypothetical protein
MVRSPDLGEMRLGINSGEEGTIEPTSSLTYELRDSVFQSAFTQMMEDPAHQFLRLLTGHIRESTFHFSLQRVPNREFDLQQDTCWR